MNKSDTNTWSIDELYKSVEYRGKTNSTLFGDISCADNCILSTWGIKSFSDMAEDEQGAMNAEGTFSSTDEIHFLDAIADAEGDVEFEVMTGFHEAQAGKEIVLVLFYSENGVLKAKVKRTTKKVSNTKPNT